MSEKNLVIVLAGVEEGGSEMWVDSGRCYKIWRVDQMCSVLLSLEEGLHVNWEVKQEASLGSKALLGVRAANT